MSQLDQLAINLAIAFFLTIQRTSTQRRVSWFVFITKAACMIGFNVSLCTIAVVIMSLTALLAALLLNDISTNLTDPPTFTTVDVRPFPAKSKKLIPFAYPDIRSQSWKGSDFETVFSACESVALDTENWEVTLVDRSDGRIEAVATTPRAGFKDDVAIRVTDATEKEKIVVDVRSVSRVGVGDLGTNAARIRGYTRDVATTLEQN